MGQVLILHRVAGGPATISTEVEQICATHLSTVGAQICAALLSTGLAGGPAEIFSTVLSAALRANFGCSNFEHLCLSTTAATDRRIRFDDWHME